MNIIFKSIEIEGFQSIGKAHIELDEQGTILIKGINNYDNMASSNGSGKSSIPESIMFALYGRTSSGINNPKNRYYSDGLYVSLKLLVDNTEYTISRSIDHKAYKTSVKIYRGTDDISGRNATDTNKIITDIIPFDKDIFLSTIFLSQGFAGKLSALTPAGRKERLEVLTDTASQIDEFKDKMSAVKNMYSGKVNELSADRSYKEGSKNSIESQIISLQNKVQEIKSSQVDYDINAIKKEIEKYQDEINSNDAEIKLLEDKKSELTTEWNTYNTKYSSNSATLRDRKSHLKMMKESSGDTICPTCGQVIKRDTIPDSLIAEKENEIEVLNSICTRLQSAMDENTSKTNDLSTKIRLYKNNEVCLRDNINLCNEQLIEASKTIDTSEYEKSIKDMQCKLPELSKEIEETTTKISENEGLHDVANHCVSLISKAFRGYMIQEIIDFMNTRLEQYSRLVFSNVSDTIKLMVDASKLDIYLGDVLYDTLSGGERKKVDIALVLAQRDLSLNISGMQCNLLILDEILENCDATASDAVLNLLSSVANDIDSMFIISHNDYSIPADSVLTVTKSHDRVASISIQ